MSMIVIKTNSISKRFGQIQAVKDISFEIKKGELFGLLGPNGAGKSTLIKILTGQIKPDTGSATVLDIDVMQTPLEVKKQIGVLPEDVLLPSFLTVGEYLDFIRDVRDRGDYGWWMDFLDMEKKRNYICKDLSRGERQKVMLAAAMMHEPDILFLDEPYMDLDPITQSRLNKYFKQYTKKGGTIIMCTHRIELAQKLCNRIGILNKGKLVSTQKPSKNLEKIFLKQTRG